MRRPLSLLVLLSVASCAPGVYAKQNTPSDACFAVRDTPTSPTFLTVCYDQFGECGNNPYNPT